MTWMLKFLAVVLACIVASESPSRAAPAERRIALVIGNAGYQAGALPTPANDAGLIAQTLQAAGFRIVRTFRNHLVVDAEAPNTVVERFFGSQIHNVLQGRYGMRYLPQTPITIPASLAPYVSGISVDNVVNAANPR